MNMSTSRKNCAVTREEIVVIYGPIEPNTLVPVVRFDLLIAFYRVSYADLHLLGLKTEIQTCSSH